MLYETTLVIRNLWLLAGWVKERGDDAQDVQVSRSTWMCKSDRTQQNRPTLIDNIIKILPRYRNFGVLVAQSQIKCIAPGGAAVTSAIVFVLNIFIFCRQLPILVPLPEELWPYPEEILIRFAYVIGYPGDGLRIGILYKQAGPQFFRELVFAGKYQAGSVQQFAIAAGVA